MHNYLYGAKTSNKLANKSIWDKILNNWIIINKNYCDEHKVDLPFWYTERADISQLAGAIWKSNGSALEEYSAIKGSGKSQHNGRIDLYFSFGKGKTYTVEAKKCWRDGVKSISKAMTNAENDVRVSQKAENADHAFAFVFQSPDLSEHLSVDEKISKIEKSNIEILETIKPDVFGYFAEVNNDYIGGFNNNIYYYVTRIIGKRVMG